MEYFSHSVEETYMIAKHIADRCTGGEMILLNGELGAGKTTFVKGFACAIGVSEIITSPTFTLMKGYYSGRIPLYHFDLYRVGKEEEIEEFGFDDYLYDDHAICIIEWNKFTYYNKRIIKIDIEYVEDGRKFTIEGM